MAALVFNAAHRKQVRHRRNAILGACREMFDAFVTKRMQQAVAKAVRPREPAHRAEAPAVELAPLDSSILSEAIPSFFIGRNRTGLWVVREATGRIGGLFLLKRSALAFARAHAVPAGCATIFPSERFELDLKNDGSVLTACLVGLLEGFFGGGPDKGLNDTEDEKDTRK